MFGWNEIVQSYITKYSNKIRSVTKPLRDHYGIDYFTYHQIDEKSHYTVLVDSPEWAERYVDQKIFLNDPFLCHPSFYQSGLFFPKDLGSKSYQKKLHSEAERLSLDFEKSLMLIKRQSHTVEFFGFTAKKDDKRIENLMLNQSALLETFGQFFKSELKSILKKMEEEATFLFDLKGEKFLHQENPMTLLQPSPDFLKKIGAHRELEIVERLTKREIECILLLLEGCTAEETAFQLDLSRRTVESYFETIFSKTSCHNKRELFQLARRLKKINLLP